MKGKGAIARPLPKSARNLAVLIFSKTTQHVKEKRYRATMGADRWRSGERPPAIVGLG